MKGYIRKTLLPVWDSLVSNHYRRENDLLHLKASSSSQQQQQQQDSLATLGEPTTSKRTHSKESTDPNMSVLMTLDTNSGHNHHHHHHQTTNNNKSNKKQQQRTQRSNDDCVADSLGSVGASLKEPPEEEEVSVLMSLGALSLDRDNNSDTLHGTTSNKPSSRVVPRKPSWRRSDPAMSSSLASVGMTQKKVETRRSSKPSSSSSSRTRSTSRRSTRQRHHHQQQPPKKETHLQAGNNKKERRLQASHGGLAEAFDPDSFPRRIPINGGRKNNNNNHGASRINRRRNNRTETQKLEYDEEDVDKNSILEGGLSAFLQPPTTTSSTTTQNLEYEKDDDDDDKNNVPEGGSSASWHPSTTTPNKSTQKLEYDDDDDDDDDDDNNNILDGGLSAFLQPLAMASSNTLLKTTNKVPKRQRKRRVRRKNQSQSKSMDCSIQQSSTDKIGKRRSKRLTTQDPLSSSSDEDDHFGTEPGCHAGNPSSRQGAVPTRRSKRTPSPIFSSPTAQPTALKRRDDRATPGKHDKLALSPLCQQQPCFASTEKSVNDNSLEQQERATSSPPPSPAELPAKSVNDNSFEQERAKSSPPSPSEHPAKSVNDDSFEQERAKSSPPSPSEHPANAETLCLSSPCLMNKENSISVMDGSDGKPEVCASTPEADSKHASQQENEAPADVCLNENATIPSSDDVEALSEPEEERNQNQDQEPEHRPSRERKKPDRFGFNNSVTKKQPSVAVDDDDDVVVVMESEGQNHGQEPEHRPSRARKKPDRFGFNNSVAKKQPSFALDDDDDLVVVMESEGESGHGRYSRRTRKQPDRFGVNTTVKTLNKMVKPRPSPDSDLSSESESRHPYNRANHCRSRRPKVKTDRNDSRAAPKKEATSASDSLSDTYDADLEEETAALRRPGRTRAEADRFGYDGGASEADDPASRDETSMTTHLATMLPPAMPLVDHVAKAERRGRVVERKVPLIYRQNRLSRSSLDVWSAHKVKQLKKAHGAVDPKSASFWSDVAARIEGVSASECQDKWFSLVQTPNLARGNRVPKKYAVVEQVDDEDDIFDSTPMKHLMLGKGPKVNQQQVGSSMDIDFGSSIKAQMDKTAATAAFASALDDDVGGFGQVNFRPKVGYKSYLQGMRRNVLRSQKERKGRKKTSGILAKGHRSLKETVHDGDVNMNACLSPGGTLKVKNFNDDQEELDDFWDETMYDGEEEDEIDDSHF